MTVRRAVTPHVHVDLALPEGAREEPESALPAVEVAGVPGASVALRVGFELGAGVTLRVVCARAPSSSWAPGLEEIVLGPADAIVQKAAGGEIERFMAGPIEPAGASPLPQTMGATPPGPRDLFVERFEGVLRRGDERFELRGRHVLGFAGEAREAVVCSAVCAAPAGEGAGDTCAPVIEDAAVKGAWVAAPPPSLMVRAVFAVAAQPKAALGICAALGLVVLVVVFARRPRPRC